MDSNRLYEQIHHHYHQHHQRQQQQQQQLRRLNRINSNSNRCRSSLGAVASAKKMLHKSHPMTKVIMFALVFLVLCCLSTQSTGQELQQEQHQHQQQPTTTTLPTTSSSSSSTTEATTTERLYHINANNDSNNNNRSFSQKNISQVNNSSGTSTTLSSIQSLIAAPTQQRQVAATTASVSTPSPVGSGRVAHQRAPGSSSKTKLSSSNVGLKQQQQQHQQIGNRSSPVADDGQRELIEQQSTSRSLSFAEPLMAASSSHAEQSTAATATHKSNSVSNRWTHFGARLRPLITASSAHLSPLEDHQRADSKSNIAYIRSGSSSSSSSVNQAPQSAQVVARAPVSSNSVDADDQDDLDDDQDSEALLYKMMQQQGFLTGSLWAQQPQQVAANGLSATGSQRAFGVSGAANAQQQQQQQQQQYHNLSSAINSNAKNNDADETGTQNSKKVIKLLKSYSHIHQVDDSDDQIRGTHTRLNVRQPAGSNSGGSYGNGWQPSGGAQYYNKNRSNEQRQQSTAAARLQPNHIFVSSQPLAQAYSNANARQQQLDARGSSGAYQPVNEGNGADQQDYSGNGGEGGQQGSAGGAPEEDDFECPNNGIFADEASGCQSYHVCQSGAQVQQKFQCPMGTLFNNIILTCDFAHNVQCKGKEASPALRPAGLEESNEPIYRQQPATALQQVPRASTQVNQGSYVPVNQQQAVSRQQQQQQTRWSPQQPPHSQLQHQPAGPRQLKIGQSQYNQHQQPQQSNMNQAVNAYPHPQPLRNDLSDNNDDSDDEPVEPLIPATLPPQSTTLPYNSPPSSSVATPTQHQSAHRSQYPASSSVNQQQNSYLAHSNYRPQVNNGYDGDSAASPVFVSRDEPRTTEASVNLVTGLYKQQQQQQQQQQNLPQSAQVSVSPAQDAQSFNLVINHLAPTRQQQTAKSGITLSSTNFKQQPATSDYLQSSNSKKAAGRQQSSSQLLPPQSPPKRVAEAKQPQQQQQQQQYQQPFIPVVPTTNSRQQLATSFTQSNALSSSVSPPRQQRPVEPQYSQSVAHYDNQRQHYQQATQPKAVHVSQPSQPSTTSLPRLQVVDLTNDKRAGVSSEALNDGLLLIVRHSNSQNNHHHQQQQQQYQDHPAAAHKQQQAARVALASNGKPRPSSGGQAFALDPSAVQPNSPIDAQLFPNVQRVLAASQPAVSHQAAQTSQYVQHVPAQTSSPPQSQQIAAAGSGPSRVSPPLAPMEPPKPIISYSSPNSVNKNSNHNNNLENQQPQYSSERTITHSDALQLIASSQSKKVSQQSEKKAPVKRSKRLKAQQVPLPSKPSTTTTTTANDSAAQVKDPKPASRSHLTANPGHKQHNQLRSVELPLQRINPAVNANQNTVVSNNKRHV